jgi:quaternary ammonium compound-resistance protein SugE
MDWLLLMGAGLLEVAFTTSMKLSDGFRRLLYTLLFLLFAAVSLWLLSIAIETIPLGTAYATWTGIGAAGTVIAGILYFGESARPARLALLALLIAGLVGLRLVS